MTQPLVTVIVPFRNQGPLLLQACRSLQGQTQARWQALLVNDGSGQEAVAAAERLCGADRRFRLLHVPDPAHFPGPWLARNLGLERASTRLVAFLDADDLWHPQKLEQQLPLHTPRHPLLSVCSYHRFRADSLTVVETRHPPQRLDFGELLRGNPIPCSSVIVDRGLLLAKGGFLPERHEDYGLWLRLFAAADRPAYRCLARPLMAYRLQSDSLSAARHRSLVAVNGLFRQHLPRRRQRWPALLGWGLGRVRGSLSRRIKPGSGEPLPQPFRSLAGPGSVLTAPAP
ncbi:MAG: glycosyltransferase family 2 protein [Synechococcaceae cyanobacterium]